MVKEKTIKSIRNWGIFIAILLLISWGLFVLIKSSGSTSDIPVNEINIISHSNIALHIHSNLDIIIDGVEFFIPNDIGISHEIMRPLHTHDSSGKIHIEAPFKRDFTIGEFFLVWEETFSSSCIFDNCIDEDKGVLTMTVNGVGNDEFENYIMKDDDQIVIEYTSR